MSIEILGHKGGGMVLVTAPQFLVISQGCFGSLSVPKANKT